MRLRILDQGHSIGTKVRFGIIRRLSGHPIADTLKLVSYRPEFYGRSMKLLTQEVMRGPSAWSIGDRELMAAIVSKVNQTEFCTMAHSLIAARAYEDDAVVSAALADLENAPIRASLRATLTVLRKLTSEHDLQEIDLLLALCAGVSPAQIEDALSVSFVFNTTDRLADAFAFSVPTSEALEAGAKILLTRGYV